MNYEYYKAFYLVATHKNITRASEELYSSQPAVSRIITNMETELNCKLFIRNKTGVSLTKEGTELFERIAEPCSKLLRADADFIKFVKTNETTVYVGATVTALSCFLFDFLERYRRKYPNIHFKIHTGSSSKMISELKKGNLEVVFNTTPFSGAENLSVEKVLEFNDILIGGSAYRSLAGKPFTVSELKKYPMILLSRGMSFREHIDDFFAKYGERITPAMEADSSSLIVPIVEKNWGLSLVPEKMAEEFIKSGQIVRLELSEPLPKRHVTLVTDRSKTVGAPVASILKMIKNAAAGSE